MLLGGLHIAKSISQQWFIQNLGGNRGIYEQPEKRVVNNQVMSLNFFTVLGNCYYMCWQHEPNPTMLFSAWVGKMELSCLLLWACPLCPARNIFPESHIQYDKSFIDWACLVKMTGYWLCSFSPNFMDLGSVSVHIHAKKNTLGQYSAILKSCLINNPYIWPSQSSVKLRM